MKHNCDKWIEKIQNYIYIYIYTQRLNVYIYIYVHITCIIIIINYISFITNGAYFSLITMNTRKPEKYL